MLVTLLIRHVRHLNQIIIIIDNMLLWLYDDILREKTRMLFTV